MLLRLHALYQNLHAWSPDAQRLPPAVRNLSPDPAEQMNIRIRYWQSVLREAERELDAATLNTTLKAAARHYMRPSRDQAVGAGGLNLIRLGAAESHIRHCRTGFFRNSAAAFNHVLDVVPGDYFDLRINVSGLGTVNTILADSWFAMEVVEVGDAVTPHFLPALDEGSADAIKLLVVDEDGEAYELRSTVRVDAAGHIGINATPEGPIHLLIEPGPGQTIRGCGCARATSSRSARPRPIAPPPAPR